MMRHTVCALACITLLISLTGTAAAQRVEIPDSGRVRITTSRWATRHVVGTVQHATADSVMVRTADSLVALPRERVRRVEVPAGRRRQVVPGMMIGAVVGATSGALAGVADCGPGSDCQSGLPAIVAAAGAGIGAILGGGIGALITGERWRDYAGPPGTAILITPEPQGVRLAVRLPSR